ncbi:MAG: PLP-dependent aminotransferase family protein [Polyangiaceae bacterium]|nr:PLP-dependent aminotransferase family protein [Polyangiaceae bacterium]
MARWQLLLDPRESDQPLFLRIARAITEDITRGRLVPGQRLPGSRPLAAQLGVHRNTVLAALQELLAQGWLTAERARGTFVSETLPVAAPTASPERRRTPRFPMPPEPDLPSRTRPFRPAPRGMVHLGHGTPDPRLFPVDALARSWRRVLRRDGPALLAYGPSSGNPALRRALAEMLGSLRGVAATPERILVTRGSQMALDLCARSLLSPGDGVAVEALGYRPAWGALRLAGATLHPVPVDDEGMDVGALARLLRRCPLRAVYVTPHHQYPTTVTMSPARRMELLALARQHRLLILEDDYDHEFHYEGRPVLPLASEDDGGTVVYLGTLSKVLAPGLRLGFLASNEAVIERLVRVRELMDLQGDHTMEGAVAEWIEEGDLQRHVRKMRLCYQERREALCEALEKHLAGALSFQVPRGGISLWAQVTPGLEVATWVEACRERGVSLVPGWQHTFDGSDPGALRLVFSSSTPAELRRAAQRMASCLPRGRGVRAAP